MSCENAEKFRAGCYNEAGLVRYEEFVTQAEAEKWAKAEWARADRGKIAKTVVEGNVGGAWKICSTFS